MSTPGFGNIYTARDTGLPVCCILFVCTSLICTPSQSVAQSPGFYNRPSLQNLPQTQIHFPDNAQRENNAPQRPLNAVAPTGPQPRTGAMQFAWNLMKTTVLPMRENIAICPLLPQTLLASLYDVADSAAKAELRSSVLASPQELSKLLRSQTTSNDRSTVNRLDHAMAMFLGVDTKINRSFNNKALQDGVDFKQVNFLNPNAAAAAANNWVTEKSRGTIREIVSPASLDPSTRILLASVIYFKGQWKHQFTKTEPQIFETVPGLDKTKAKSGPTVPMMYQFNRFRYGVVDFPDGNGIRWVDLPYEGSTGLSMILMLPKVRHQLQRSAEQLSVDQVQDIIASLKQNRGSNKVHLQVPKFALFSSLSLVPALKNLGLRAIFDRSTALNALSNEPLVVRDVSQRTYISIDEQGTTATSAAALSFVALSALPPPPTINFTVDEPFLLMIVDKAYEYPLFVAKVVKPDQN
uniref:Serpin domain-containing protein n=1 Tax=Anopheles farauti TaxID=69004 RepID=A0A182QDT7_9DIPT